MKKEFLGLLKDAKRDQLSNEIDLDFMELYKLASEHQVTGLVYNQIYNFKAFPADLKNHWKNIAIKENVFQTMKTDRFLRLYQKLLDHGLKIIVVKGIICRSLYPQPDNRPSNDEDLYIEKEYLELAREVFINDGFIVTSESDDVVTFGESSCGLSIELHTSLFSKDSKAYGHYQDAFDHAFKHMLVHEVQGVPVYTLSYDLHLLFLLMHFIKHFLHGGVGIRQILDIIIYSETYGNLINWSNIYQTLDELNVLILIKNVFALSHEYLDFDFNKITLPDDYNNQSYDYDELLDDIIDAGIFGKSSEARLHSSTMTLNALNSGKTSIVKSIFPTFKEMKAKYVYLNKHPYLLPIAYLARIINYLKHNDSANSQKTIEIGNHRIELLKKYKLIK